MRTHGIGDGGDEGEVVTCPLRVVAWPAVGVPTNGTLWAGDLVRTAGIMGYPITGPTSNTSPEAEWYSIRGRLRLPSASGPTSVGRADRQGPHSSTLVCSQPWAAGGHGDRG